MSNTEKEKITMINIKLSQYFIFHLVKLTDEQKQEINAARENAKQFIQSGNKKYPIVDFYVENDRLSDADAKKAFGKYYDGKGFKVSYGLLPETTFGRFPIIHPCDMAVFKEVKKSPLIREYGPIYLEYFNKWGDDLFKFEPINYKHPLVDATHMICLNDLDLMALTFPLYLWEKAFALHYLFNELNSNRKWKNPDTEDTHDVLRFQDNNNNIIYYALLHEHTPDGAISSRTRNYLFKEVNEKEIVFVD